jgi:uncharacterized protein HemX
MKAFWAILAALILTGGAYLFVAARQSQASAAQARAQAAAQKAKPAEKAKPASPPGSAKG